MRFLHRQPVLQPAEATDADALLVAWAQQSPQAFTGLYDRYFPAIYGYCLSQLGEAEAAADAASQTFLQALAALPGYRETGRFRSWLFAIAHNAIRDQISKRRPDSALEEAGGLVDPEPSPEEMAIAVLDRIWLDGVIARLSPDDRKVIELRRAGLTGQEIASVLGISREAAKKRQLRAIERIRADVLAASRDQEVGCGA